MLLFPKPWYAVQVASQMESKVALGLQARQYEIFAPTYKERRTWSDRSKTLELPLFPGYIFCRLADENIGLAVSTPGVRRIVGFGGKLCPIQDEELETIRKLAILGDSIPVPYATLGEKVEITEGPLAGIVGVITRLKSGCRLIVSVELIMKSISIDIEESQLAPIALRATLSKLRPGGGTSHDSLQVFGRPTTVETAERTRFAPTAQASGNVGR
jgi:transcription antitermination factor NusG